MVCALDPIPWRLQMAQQFGADVMINPQGRMSADVLKEVGREFDVVIEAAGVQSALDWSGDLVRQHGRIVLIDEKSVVPWINQMLLRQRFDVRKIHDHAIIGVTLDRDNGTGERNFQRVAMAVQIAALALMVGNAMTGIEFELAGNSQHGNLGNVDNLVGLQA